MATSDSVQLKELTKAQMSSIRQDVKKFLSIFKLSILSTQPSATDILWGKKTLTREGIVDWFNTFIKSHGEFVNGYLPKNKLTEITVDSLANPEYLGYLINQLNLVESFLVTPEGAEVEDHETELEYKRPEEPAEAPTQDKKDTTDDMSDPRPASEDFSRQQKLTPTKTIQDLLKAQREFIEAQTLINQEAIRQAAAVEAVLREHVKQTVHNSDLADAVAKKARPIIEKHLTAGLSQAPNLEPDTIAHIMRELPKIFDQADPGLAAFGRNIPPTTLHELSQTTHQALQNSPSRFVLTPQGPHGQTTIQKLAQNLPTTQDLGHVLDSHLQTTLLNPAQAQVVRDTIITQTKTLGIVAPNTPDLISILQTTNQGNDAVASVLASLTAQEKQLLETSAKLYTQTPQFVADAYQAAIPAQADQALTDNLNQHFSPNQASQIRATIQQNLPQLVHSPNPTNALNQHLSPYQIQLNPNTHGFINHFLGQIDTPTTDAFISQLSQTDPTQPSPAQLVEFLKTLKPQNTHTLLQRALAGFKNTSADHAEFASQLQNLLNTNDVDGALKLVSNQPNLSLFQNFRRFLLPTGQFAPPRPQPSVGFLSNFRTFISSIPTNIRLFFTSPTTVISNFTTRITTFFSNLGGGSGGLLSKVGQAVSGLGRSLAPAVQKAGQLAAQGAAALGRMALAGAQTALTALGPLLAAAAPYAAAVAAAAVILILAISLIKGLSHTSPGGIARSQQIAIPAGGSGPGPIANYCVPGEYLCPNLTCPTCTQPVNCGYVSQCPNGDFSHDDLNAIDYIVEDCPADQLGVYYTLPYPGTISRIYMAVADGDTSGGGYGNFIDVTFTDSETGRNFIMRYAHLSLDSHGDLEVGNTINTSQIIAIADHTGYSTNPHLHVELIAVDGGVVPHISTLIPGTRCG